MNTYESSYTKYWPNKDLWEIAFLDALPNDDKTRLKWAIEQQAAEMPNREQPVTVDCFAKFCQPTFHRQSCLYDRDPGIGENKDQELKFLQYLADMRDEPNSVLQEEQLPECYWRAPYFLKDIQQTCIEQNYLTDEQSYLNLHKKGILDTTHTEKKYTLALEFGTLRTQGEYVHNDSPFMQWQTTAGELLNRGFKTRCESTLLDTCGNCNHRFGTGGIVSINGLYGEALRRLAPISFTGKWDRLEARPEQYAFEKGEVLSQVFPEGSPPHPSEWAMHFYAAQILAYITAIVFDSCEDFMGEPLYKELQLQADYISYGRCSAGVHFPRDNKYKNSAKIAAEEICSDVYGETCTVPVGMLDVDYSIAA